jgi:hypothetical protein
MRRRFLLECNDWILTVTIIQLFTARITLSGASSDVVGGLFILRFYWDLQRESHNMQSQIFVEL